MPRYVKEFYGPAKLSGLPGYLKLALKTFSEQGEPARFFEWKPIPAMPPACDPVQDHGVTRSQYRSSVRCRLKKHLDRGQALSLIEGLKNDPTDDAENLRGMIKNRIKKL